MYYKNLNQSFNPFEKIPEMPGLKRKGVQNFLSSSQTLVRRGVIYDDYDEPTYVGFAIKFDFYTPHLPIVPGNYDYMPEGLLGGEGAPYSAESYLKNINEFQRSEMIKAFNILLHNISENTPHYIQSISGLNTLYKLDPQENYRGKESIIKLKFLEGIDLRVSAMMDLYRRAAFDTTWMRWVLPDIHRYFSMKIWITEFRSFHVPRYAERTSTDKIDNSKSKGYDSLKNVYGNNGKNPLNSLVQEYKDQYNGIKQSYNNILNGISNTISAIGGNNKQNNDKTNSKYFLKQLDRNLNIIEFNLHQCEFVLKNMNIPYGDEISNTTQGEMLSPEIEIKVGKIEEVAEYSIIGATLGIVLDSIYSSIRNGIFSDKSIDINWQKGIDRKIIQKTDNNFYNNLIHDYSTEISEDVYQSSSFPYGRGHLGNTEDIIKKSLGERLLETGIKQLGNELSNVIETYTQGKILGNVYGFSPATLAKRLTADPRALGEAFIDFIKKTNTKENANAILENIYNNLPEFSNELIGNPGNMGLSGSNAVDLNPTNINLEGSESNIDGNPGNVDLSGPTTQTTILGNIGLTGAPSSQTQIDNINFEGSENDIDGNPGNVDLSGANSNINGNLGNINLSGSNTNIEGNTENIGLTGTNSNTDNNLGNIDLSGSNSNINGNLGNIDLTGPEKNDNLNPKNIKFDDSETNLQRKPGNIGLTGNEITKKSNLSNIGFDKTSSTIDNKLENIKLTGVNNSIEDNKLGNINLKGNNSTINGKLKNIDFTDKNKQKNKSLKNIGYSESNNKKQKNLGNIKLSGAENNIEGEKMNINLSGEKKTELKLGNIKFEENISSNKNLKYIGNVYIKENKKSKNNITKNIEFVNTNKKTNQINKNINYENKKRNIKENLGNIGLTGEYLRKQKLGNIGLTESNIKEKNIIQKNIGFKENNKEKEILKNINLTGNETKQKTNLGNINFKEKQIKQENNLKNIELTGNEIINQDLKNVYSKEDLENNKNKNINEIQSSRENNYLENKTKNE